MATDSALLILGLIIGSSPAILILLSVDYLTLDDATKPDISNPNPARVKRHAQRYINGDYMEHQQHHNFVMDDIADPDVHYRPSGPYQRRAMTDQDKVKSKVEHKLTPTAQMTGKQGDTDIVSALDGLGLKHELYTAVLTSETRVAEVSSAVRMTWGSDMSKVLFFYPTPERSVKENGDGQIVPLNDSNEFAFFFIVKDLNTEKAFTPEHTLEVLNSMCMTVPDDYFWYMLTVDRFYIDSTILKQALKKRSPFDSHIFGDTSTGQCELNRALLLSVTAFRKFCTGVRRCNNPDESTSVGACLQAATGTACTAVEEVLAPKAGIQIFEPVPSTNAMLERHLKIVDDKIAAAERKLSSLSSSIEKASRASVNIDIDSFLSFNAVKLQKGHGNNMGRPTHSLVEMTVCDGNCQFPNMEVASNVESSLNIDANGTYSPYKDARLLSDLTYMREMHENKNSSASVRIGFVSKTNDYANMFEFYYVEKGDRGTEKVIQITVGQDMGSFEVIESEVVSPVPVNIITRIENATVAEVDKFVSMIHNACHNGGNVSICNSTILTISTFEHIHLDHGIQKIFRSSINARMAIVQEGDMLKFLEENTVSGILVFVPFKSSIDGAFLKRCQLNTKRGASSYFPIAINEYEQKHWTSQNHEFQSILRSHSIFQDDLANRYKNGNFQNLYQTLLAEDKFAVNRVVDPGFIITG